MKNFADVKLSGVILWSDAFKQKNNKYLHKYIIGVEDNVKKHNFHVISFNEKSSKPSYRKNDLVKVSGTLKVNSYKKGDEWKNEVYVQADEIERLDE